MAAETDLVLEKLYRGDPYAVAKRLASIIGPIGPAGPRGPQGEKGEQGEPGPQGIQGWTGEQGPIGLRGPKGRDGVDSTVPGPRGPEGPRGEKGAQGIAGKDGADSEVEGPIGPPGIQGIQGERGPAGADSTVPGPEGPRGVQGLPGEQGERGPQGIQGNPGERGAEGPPGETAYSYTMEEFEMPAVNAAQICSVASYTPFKAGMIVFIEGLGWLDVIYIWEALNRIQLRNVGYFGNAAPGTISPMGALIVSAGPAGPQGIQGAVGPKGDQGEQGEKGDTGEDSTVPGPPGDRGPQGELGERGPQGIQGETGRAVFNTLGDALEFRVPAIGSPALAWCNEPTLFHVGHIVSIGEAGYFTVTRIAGPDSRQLIVDNPGYPENQPPGTFVPPGALLVLAGPRGTPGEEGPRGWDGERGPAGEQGIQGVKGDQGDRGEQGVQGPAGDQGPRGDQGDRGLQGDKGDAGDKGDRGARGQESFSALSNQFVMPAIGAAGIAYIQEASPIPSNAIVMIAGLGYLRRGVGGALNIALWNDVDYPGNAEPGTIAPGGALIVAVGPRGPQGVPGPPAGIGEWQNLQFDVGWLPSSWLRFRTIDGGAQLQMVGVLGRNIQPSETPTVGLLPPSHRPRLSQGVPVYATGPSGTVASSIIILESGVVGFQATAQVNSSNPTLTIPLDIAQVAGAAMPVFPNL